MPTCIYPAYIDGVKTLPHPLSNVRRLLLLLLPLPVLCAMTNPSCTGPCDTAGVIDATVVVEDDELFLSRPGDSRKSLGSSDGDGLGRCPIVGGNLWISGRVTSLRALDNIEEIRGILSAGIAGGMTVFRGLDRVSRVGSWVIVVTEDGHQMEDIAGLNALTEAFEVTLDGPLNTITGLQSLTRVHRALTLGQETRLDSFPGLRNLEEAGEIRLGTVNGSLSDFASLRVVHGSFTIERPRGLQRFDMPQLETVDGRFEITAPLISAELPKLVRVGDTLVIEGTRFNSCDVGLNALRNVDGDLQVEYNPDWPQDCVDQFIAGIEVGGVISNVGNGENFP